MKYLCLAYGSEEDWNKLSEEERSALLAQDDVLRSRGSLVAAVGLQVTTVRAWDGTPAVSEGPLTGTKPPLAGFGIVAADDLNEAIRLIADTPCARAKGAVEIRPITTMNAASFEEET